jgi:hypothetical protein
MAGRPSTPDEQPPRRRGGRAAWLVGTVPGLVGVAFVLIAIAVLVLVVL